MVPRSQGFDVLIVNVFDTERLRSNAAADPKILDIRIAEIELVDIVGDASGLGEDVQRLGLAGQMDFIVSSHNLEHLPNPLRFLQGGATALRPGGVLTMAIPDYRACFDHFRMPTRLSDWLGAYHEGRSQPTPADIFDSRSGFALFPSNGQMRGTLRNERDEPAGFVFQIGFKQAYDAYQERLKTPAAYCDIHCNTLFGELFERLVLEFRYPGIIDLEILTVTETRAFEFFVHMGKAPAGQDPMPVAEFDTRRLELARVVNANLGTAVFINRNAKRANQRRRAAPEKRSGRPRRQPAGWGSAFKAAMARALGEKATKRLRQWRRARKSGGRTA